VRERHTQLQFPELVDINTLAELLGTSVRHLRRLVAERRIPYVKVGHYLRFDLREIVAWLERSRFTPLADDLRPPEPVSYRSAKIR